MPETRNILGIGFPILNKFDPKGDVLEKQKAQAEAQGFDLTIWLVDAVNEPPEKVLADFKQKLEEKQYAAVSIGFGVRGNRDITPVFEKMVNLCIEMQPGVKMAFANLPDDVVDACQRVLS